ncbi:CD225/dispanin family protein [Gordonia aurantiaca]|uniref:CD225/dispanin family protein n=1 Tax=Gordonia sp. B21 TaxID=3151852 RepID=UPI003264608E
MTYPNDPNQAPYGVPGHGQPPYGAYAGGPPPGPEPDNNLVWAILSTVLCCLPTGIVAIVKSTSVSKLWAAGDFAGAQKAADEARKWAIWGAVAAVVLWILIVLIYVVFFVILVSAAATGSTY